LWRKRKRRQCRNRVVGGGRREIGGGGIGAVGARWIDQLIAGAGEHLLALAKRRREQPKADCERGYRRRAPPPEMKRKVHMIPPLNSDKSPQKLMRRSTWTLLSNWIVVALSVQRPSGLLLARTRPVVPAQTLAEPPIALAIEQHVPESGFGDR